MSSNQADSVADEPITVLVVRRVDTPEEVDDIRVADIEPAQLPPADAPSDAAIEPDAE